ncbi:MAG: tRNA (guanosine(46)-N7)-methyltransferase TrmB [Rhodothermales bacterium]|nr:tRNA (guanosine(46)-N7)-methyltransferase TrmB [Rhodothermales bacterium]
MRYDGGVLLRKKDFGQGPQALFERDGPLVVEIGFGDGRFLVELDRLHPEWNTLGVEISLASVSRAFRRMHRENVRNVRLYRGHGRMLVRDFLTEDSVRRIYVNFPDPWPRRRQVSNRLLQPRFFRMAANRLQADGDLMLTTDHKEYFQFARASAADSGVFSEEVLPPPAETLRTKYALKWQDQERPIYHVVFRPTARPAAPEPRTVVEAMQHALMQGDLHAVSTMDKHVRRFDGGVVVVAQAYRSLDGKEVLFEVVVEEADLRQELLVKARKKESGIYVALEPFGDPMGTRGCREAVRAVTEVLEQQGLRTESTWI